MVAAQNNCTFMEVSAKEDINVSELFTQLAMNIIGNLESQMEEEDKGNNSSSGKVGIERRCSNILVN